MITWENAAPVFAKFPAYNDVILQLIKFNKKNGQLMFTDKSGTIYYTYRKYCEFILPDYWIPTYRISDLMIIGKGDYYE